MDIRIPEDSLVVLCGVAGCGKSTFAANNFRATEIVSSDRCRAIISDDEGSIEVSKDAFELFHFIIEKRMKAGKLVVADSTALSYEARKRLLRIAHDNNYYVILLAFDVPLEKAIERNSARDRQVPEKVIKNQYNAFKKSLGNIKKEGFKEVIILQEEDIKDANCTIIPSNKHVPNRDLFNNVLNISGYSQPMQLGNGDFEEFIRPLYFRGRDGQDINISKEEAQEAVRLLCQYHDILPWIVYIPPFIPSLSRGNITNQIEHSLKYYADQGMRKCIIEKRKQNSTHILVLSKNKECSNKYFSSDSYGQIYSPNIKPQIEEQDSKEIINILYDGFKGSGYFEYHNTDYIIFEALIYDIGVKHTIVPVKIIGNSRRILLDRDNLWQIENTGKFETLSEIIKKNEVLILDSKGYKKAEIDSFIRSGEYQGIVVKPVKVYTRHKDHFFQPEILCSANNCLYGDECIKLSAAAHELGYMTSEMFIKNKNSKKYFEFLIGCVTINNRMSKMRM